MSVEILDYIARTPLQDMVQNIIAMTTHTKYMTDFKKQQDHLLLFLCTENNDKGRKRNNRISAFFS